jgi:hypothetical protein
MRPTLCLLSFVACATVSAANAQVLVGPVSLVLGESRSAALSKLRAEFQVDSMASASGDQWLVKDRGGPPYVFRAWVGFSKGRLTYLSRSWDAGAPRDEQAVLRAVVRALSQLSDSSNWNCDVSGSRSAQPGSETELITITCGTHSVTISVGSVGTSPASGIEESWKVRKPQ